MLIRNAITWCDPTRLGPRIGGAPAHSLTLSLYIGVLLVACFGGCPAPQAPGGSSANDDLGVDPATSPPVGNSAGDGDTGGQAGGDGIDPASNPGGDEIHISDQVLATTQDTPLTFVLDMEPSLAEGLDFSVIAPPEAGTVSESRDGGRIELTYAPNQGFFGQDEFLVEVSDGTSGSIASITIIVHPEVRFEAVVLSQQPVLLVEAHAFTMAGHDLPAGTYTWNADGQPESGSVSTHASQQFSFATTGTHILSLTLTLAGMSTPISCSYGPAGDVKTATFSSQDGSEPIQSRLSVTPDTGLQSSGDQGGPFTPDSIAYTVTNLGRKTMDWGTDVTKDWVFLSQTSGRLAKNESVRVNVRLNANTNNLPTGNHQAEITFKNLTKGRGHIVRPVLLVVNGSVPAPGVLAVSPAGGLDSSGLEGGPFNPDSIRYRLTNEGGERLEWGASNGRNWVSLSGSGGSLDPGEFVDVAVSINAAANALPAGPHGDTVSFVNVTNGNGDAGRGVSLVVNSPPGALLVSPASAFSSSGDPGGPFNPASEVYNVENTGGQPLSWTASKNEEWVSLSNVGGNLAPGGRDTVVVSINSNANGLAAGSYSDTVSFTNVTNGSGDTMRSVSLTVNAESGACQTSTSVWQNSPITAQTGVFTARFDAVPNDDNMTGHTVLSEGPGATYQDYAILIGFGPLGFINARDGGSYRAETQITYTAGTTYHFRVEVNVSAHTYSVYVTPEGSGELTLAMDFAFRTEQNAVAGLDHWGLMAQSGWSHEVCNFVIASGGGMLSVSPGDGLTSSGNEGGPFSPDSKQYVLTNTGDAPIDWSASKSQAWLDLSPAGGLLDAGASTTVAVSINANANGLSAGIHQDSVTLTNDTNGAGDTSRPVSLTVNSTVGVLAVTPSVGLSSSGFEGGPFDPSSLTYTLNNVGATAIGYSVAKSAAWLSLNGGDGPLTGSLAPAETFQVAVSINANANGLSADTYPDSVTFANTTNGLGNTARSVSLNVRTPGSGTPTPVIVASRISGIAPFAVFFEGTESTDSNGRKIGDSTGGDGLLGNDLVEYTWDFGPGSEGDVGGRYFSGFNAAHVYETPGQYDVRLTVREEPVPGQSSSASTTLRVDAQPFSGTTYYVRADGNDNNPGTGPSASEAWRTYNKAFNAISSNRIVQPGDRVLFNRGDVFNYSSGSHLGSARNVLIAAYGTGNRPRIQYTGSSAGAVPIRGGANAISIVDIIIDGNNVASLAYGSDNRLFLRMRFTNYNQIPIYADLTFVVDSVLTNAIRQNMYYNGSRLALINNSIGPVQHEHNLYGSHIDRAVITGNYFHDSGRHGLRIAANSAPGSWNIVVSRNKFERNGLSSINLKVTSPGSTYGGHNIVIEQNDIDGGIDNQRDGYTDLVVRNNLIRSLVLTTVANPQGAHRAVRGLRVYNNTFVGGGIRILTLDHRDVQLSNNIIQVSAAAGPALSIAGGLTEIASNFNLFHSTDQGPNPAFLYIEGSNYTLSEWQNAYNQGWNTSIGDPRFDPTSPSGRELQPGSPAIDTGETLARVYDDCSTPPVRRLRGLYDCGAFEKE